MDEALGDVRDRHLRAAAVPVRGRAADRSRSPASTPSWPRSSSAPSPTNAKLTLHLGTRYGSNAHHMIEACFKAFARALREAVSIDPDEPGVPSTKGTLTLSDVRIAILDYGMGNLRSVEKALERVGAEVEITSDPDRAAAADGLILPGVGRLSARRWTRIARARPRRADRASGSRRACRCSASASACSSLFESSTELGGAPGLGLLAGEVTRARRARAEAAAHRLGAGALERESELFAGIDDGDAVLLRPRLRAPPADDGRRRRRPPSTASGSPARSRARRSSASSSTRRSRAPPGLRLLCQLRRGSAPRSRPALDPLPGDRHPRRPRGAPACRATTSARPSSTPTRSTPRSAGSSRAREALHVVDLDGAARGRPVNLEHVDADLRARSTCRCRSAAGCAAPRTSRRSLAAGARRAVLGTAALADPALIEALAPSTATGSSSRPTPAAGRIAVEGWERETQIDGGGAGRRAGARGVRRFVYTPVEVDGTLEGPGARRPGRGRRRRRRRPAPSCSTRAGSARSSTCARWPRWRCPRSPA